MPAYPNNLSGIQSQLSREKLPVGWPWRFLTIMAIVFLAALLSYLGLEFGYKPYLQRQYYALQTQVNSEQNTIASTQKDYVNYYSQIINIGKLLRNHVNPSAFLPFLASSTEPKVSYSSIKVTVLENKIDISGTASSYAVLASQLQVYENAPQVTRAVLDGSELSGNTVSFQATLYVNPGLFTYNQTPVVPGPNNASTTINR